MSLQKYILRTQEDPENWQFYKRQEACDWSAEEFDFTKEKDDYEKSPKNIKKLLKGIFGFFLIGDGLISEDVVIFLKEAIREENWPLVYYLSMQLKVENTHAETYSKAALTIIPEEEQEEMMKMSLDLKCIKDKGEWIKKYVDSTESPALRYVACAVGEGVFFVSLFAVIFYLRKLNLFKNFIESNEQISKDESIHRDQKAMEAKRLLKISEHERAKDIIMSGVEIEKEHARYLLSDPIMGEQADKDAGLTLENIFNYIEMLADQVAILCGLDLIYKTSAELPWMEDINLSQKTNFYERDVVGSYRKFNPQEEVDNDLIDPEDEDF
jgi:ribonucleoside-diphosphate reductase subunit M2